MIRAVCFDMFDTLANARGLPERAESEAVGVTEEEWGRAVWEKKLCYDRGIGRIRSTREMVDRACENLGVHPASAQREAAAKARDERLRKAVTEIDPQITETVRELKRRGYRIGLISNADVCDRLYWQESPVSAWFDDAIFSCDVGLLKPDEAIYRLSLEHLGVTAGEALFVGDGGDRELAGARAAGLTTVCTEYLFTHRDRTAVHAYADYVIREFRELISLTERI